MSRVLWTQRDILDATGGTLAAGPASLTFTGVSIDSRTVGLEDLFVAVSGERHDGHGFIPEVVAKGVRGVVLEGRKVTAEQLQTWRGKGVLCVTVPDTIRALGDLAAFHRRRFDIPVAAVTGSNGKTSTKEMIASVLNRNFTTLKTTGNLNNEFGAPLTLLRLDRSHGAAVVEMGMNHPGEIRRLSAICRPTIGVITNVAPAHLEGLGTVENVRLAKGELLENIRPGGTAVLNGDNPHTRWLGERSPRPVLYFGLSETAQVRAEAIEERGIASRFTLVLPDARIAVELPAPGRFMVVNALAAAAVGWLAKVAAPDIALGLAAFAPVGGRMNIRQAPSGYTLIDDSYNANPGSMEAAIMTLASFRGRGRLVLAAGDMRELGPDAPRLHREIGRVAVRAGLDRLFLTGLEADSVKAGAMDAGMREDHVLIGEKPELAAALKDFLRPGDTVLVKGSRSMGMETLVRLLLTTDDNP